VLTGGAVYLLAGFVSGHPPRLRRTALRGPATTGAEQLWLTQAGVRLKPVQFWVGSIGVGSAVFVLVALATHTPAVAVVPAVTAAAIPRLYFTRVRARRLRDVQAAWPDGLRQIVASIAAGMSLPQSLAGLAVSGPVPLREAFTRFGSLANMVGAVAALEVVSPSSPTPPPTGYSKS
jgi:tight adherence protein B